MSVAYDLDVVAATAAPGRLRPAVPPVEAPSRLASVHVLRPPADLPGAPPLRLTRRGVVVLALAVALLAVGLVAWARASAPAASGPSAPAPAVVTVAPGDTLWSIAGRVAPNADPRAEVAALQRSNHLHSVELTPGQRLRVP